MKTNKPFWDAVKEQEEKPKNHSQQGPSGSNAPEKEVAGLSPAADTSTLSDKMVDNNYVGGPPLGDVLWAKDVKESIKRLKKELDSEPVKEFFKINVLHEVIDKIFGDKLT